MNLFADLTVDPETDDEPICDVCEIRVDKVQKGFKCKCCGAWYHFRCGGKKSPVCRFCERDIAIRGEIAS